MTIGERFSRRGCCNGFTWLRLALAVGIFTFHSVTISYGSADAIPPVPMALAQLILPMFFALSGFLVAGSLTHSASLTQFATFRVARLAPALVAVVFVSMFVAGPLVTTESLRDYFSDKQFIVYLGNIAAQTQYGLPGVFLHNPRAGVVNGSLWTIPVELWCYALLVPAFLLGLTRRRKILVILALLLLTMLTIGFCAGSTWAGRLPMGELVLPFVAGVVIFAASDWIPGSGPLAAGLFAVAVVASSTPHWAPVAALPLAYATVWLGMRTLPVLHGDYSYGLYLIGYPLQQFYVAQFPHGAWWTTWLVCLPLALGSAAVLWHCVEKPVLARKACLFPRLAGASISDPVSAPGAA
jgi:peptidoglycan/LPS O-acetylase OafA/YrhL